MYDPNYIKFNMCRVKDKKDGRRKKGRRGRKRGREEALWCRYPSFTERKVRRREVKQCVQCHGAKTLRQDLNPGLADSIFAKLGELRQG